MQENEERKKFQKVDTDSECEEIDFHQLYPTTVKYPFPDPSEYKIKKRTPTHIIHKNDIYISTKSHFIPQLRRAQKLLDNECKTVIVHGMGKSTLKACNFAAEMKEIYGDSLIVSPKTETVKLVDDFEPLKDGEPFI
eukprot:gene4102-7390_t